MKLKVILFMLITFTCGALHAQVTIGADQKPIEGALLQLKENNNTTHNSTKGFMLPRVKLTSLTVAGTDLRASITGAPAAGPEWNTTDHIGLLVFHVGGIGVAGNPLFEPNIYVWEGTKWMLVKAS